MHDDIVEDILDPSREQIGITFRISFSFDEEFVA